MDKGNKPSAIVYESHEYLNTQQDAIELLVIERDRQRDKWGDQHYMPLVDEMLVFQEELGEFCRATLEGTEAHALQELVEATACLLQMIERRLHHKRSARVKTPPRMPCHYSDFDGGEHY